MTTLSPDTEIARIKSDLRWVTERLHDSQEHAQIVRLEEKRERLWAELKRLEPNP